MGVLVKCLKILITSRDSSSNAKFILFTLYDIEKRPIDRV